MESVFLRELKRPIFRFPELFGQQWTVPQREAHADKWESIVIVEIPLGWNSGEYIGRSQREGGGLPHGVNCPVPCHAMPESNLGVPAIATE